jgi:OmpA-OmpF porin, OOP family
VKKTYKPFVIFAAAITASGLAGCSTLQGTDGATAGSPLCALLGAAVGGGGAAAVASGAGPIGAGVAIGALLGSLACPKTQPVAIAAAPTAPIPPVAVAPAAPVLDSDGDGVIDSADLCPNTPAGTAVDSNGCPAILLTLTGVNFKFDSSAIEPASEQLLNQAVDALNSASAVQVRVVGHTDSIGTDEYNVHLSDRRAKAVVDYLVDHGIAASRLQAEGRGEREPVQSNQTAEGRFQNRRVEFHVSGKDAAARDAAPALETSGAKWKHLDSPASKN